MKKLLLLSLFAVTVLSIHAEEWIDVTERYIVNPSFDGNDRTTGWSGTQFGAASPKENAEHYYKTFNTYQDITVLKAGKYRLFVNAFYRMGNTSNDYNLYKTGDYADSQLAVLYATVAGEQYSQKIQPVSSGMVKTPIASSGYASVTDWVYGNRGWEQSVVGYVPNNMFSADAWFARGYYQNYLEFEVKQDGVVRIGVRKDESFSEDWMICDNFRLESWENKVYVSSITLPVASVSMVPTETYAMSYVVKPSNATSDKVSWSSSDNSVATVNANGVVSAIKNGTCTITATAMDGSNCKANCTVVVSAPAVASSENIVINELMAANVDVYRDPSTNFGSWVELYNPTSQSVVLGGLYVTDDPNDLKKHKLVEKYGALPAKGFAVLNFDHYEPWTELSNRQIDNKLDCDGGTIYVTNGTEILAMQNYPAAISRVSYARTIDGGDTWSTTAEPTPGASNATSQFAENRLAAPVVNTPAGLFTGSMTFEVEIPEGATLRYTMDGTAPTLTNGETSATGSFFVDQSVTYRFRLYAEGYLPSPVVTRTFINSTNEPFPIISVVTDKNNMFESDYGIFKFSQYGRPGNGQTTKYNANMDWDRPVNFEYITTDNECVISQEVDLSACGGWSRGFEPHSFKLKASKQYEGLNSLDYQFFDEKPFQKHKVLQIRNGGNDNGCRIKDGALQQIIARSGLYLEHQAWQPVHVYVNAKPYAVLNMREPNNKHYGYSNYGMDTDLMDQFEMSPDSGYVQMAGTKDAFNRIYELAKTADNSESYAEISKLVDIDEFVNYLALQLYLGNWDMPQNNIKGFRDQADGKFRFVVFDLDGALSDDSPIATFLSKQNYNFDVLHGYDYSQNRSIEGSRLNKEIEFVTMVRNLWSKNDEFRKKFIDAFCLMGGSVFTPEKSEAVISECAQYIASLEVYPYSTSNKLIDGLKYRNNTMISHLQGTSLMNLGNVEAQKVKLASNIPGAAIRINGMDVPYGEFNGNLFAPITLTAAAPAGYKFVGWEEKEGVDDNSKNTIFDFESEWKYTTTLQNTTNWRNKNFNDNSWKSGTAPLGYGSTKPAIETAVSSGWINTMYVRSAFTVDNVKPTDVFVLDYKYDDGIVVYVNGVEAGRDNMPEGDISSTAYATKYAEGNPNIGKMTLPASLFADGTNVISVEIHNCDNHSSDLLWDASLNRTTISENTYVSTNPVFEMPATGEHDYVAVWEKVDETELVGRCAAPIKINELSSANDSKVNEHFKKDDWVELYNTTDTPIDVAGLYLSDNAAKPTKFKIEKSEGINTIVPAHGYIIVWCSKREGPHSQIHASFKLGNTDGSLLLLSSSNEFVSNNKAFFDAHDESMKSFTDTLYYNTLAADQTVGRYPDGANEYFVMNCPTIAKENKVQTSDCFVYKDVFSIADDVIPGDADGDGLVTMADANLVVNYYLGKVKDADIHLKEADADGDGKVTIADANVIVNVYLTK